MLHIPSEPQAYTATAAFVKPDIGQRPKQIAGRDLARWVKKAGATTRAFIAADLGSGHLNVTEMTARQAQTMARASLGYANTVAKLTAKEREQVATGKVSLSTIHNKKKSSAFAAWARAANEVERELGYEEITVGDFLERVYAKLGPDGRASLSATFNKMWPITTATAEAAE